MSAGQGFLACAGGGLGAANAAAMTCCPSCEVDLAASKSVAKRAVTGSIKSDFDNRTAHSYDGFAGIERKKCIDSWIHCSMCATCATVSVLAIAIAIGPISAVITARAASDREDYGNTAMVNKRGSSKRATCKGMHIPLLGRQS